MSDTGSRKGRCFCGGVEVTVSGAPIVMGYCHCASCREWSAGPVNAFVLWPRDAVRVTKGENLLGTYAKTPQSERKWCTRCGGHVFSDHPTLGFKDVFAAILPSLRFEPSVHVNYGETVLRIRDGLPKQKDFPKEMGGSGQLLPE